MRRYLVGLITLVVICLFAGRSTAQSNVHSQEERGVFAQMDPVLEGFWEGHAGANDGMKYDPVAIACMLSKCSRVHNESSADPNQLRDARNFQTCYAAHLARVQSGYVRLASPPPISVLGCNLIAAQAKSTDDRVYAAVNGRPRNQPPTTTRAKKHRRANVSIDERAYLLAQMNRLPADSGASADTSSSANVAPKAAPKPSPARPKLALKPTVRPTAPKAEPPRTSARASDNPYVDDESKDKLVLVSANDREAKIYVKPGGQFYAIRSSYLAKKYDTDWKAVYTNAANQYADFIGSCWKGNKVRLDPDRMNAKSYDKAKLDGPVDDKFMKSCDGEFNFALQAGRTITLSAKSVAQGAKTAGSDRPPVEKAPPVEKPKQADESADSGAPPPATDLDASVVESGMADLPDASVKADGEDESSADGSPPPFDAAGFNVPVIGAGQRGTSANQGHGTIVLFAFISGAIVLILIYLFRPAKRGPSG